MTSKERYKRYYESGKHRICTNYYRKKMYEELGVSFSFYQSFVRPMVQKLKGNKCSKCGNTKNIDVHHSSLELINIDTLILLCRKCHKQLHKNETRASVCKKAP